MTEDQIKLITRTVAKGATQDELAMFLNVCKRAGLDPFTKQIHMVKRKDSVTIQVGIDGFRSIAERSGTLAGIEDVVYDDESAKFPKQATVTVYRMVAGKRVPFTASARWEEYFPGDKLGFMWKKMPYLMLGKCAEALALRKAFPADLSGLYTEDEMHQAGVTDVEPESPKKTKETKKKDDEIAARMQSDAKVVDAEVVEVKEQKDVAEEVAEAFYKKVVEEDSPAARAMKEGMKSVQQKTL